MITKKYRIIKKTPCKSGRTLLTLEQKTSYGSSTIFLFEDRLGQKMLEKNFTIIH